MPHPPKSEADHHDVPIGFCGDSRPLAAGKTKLDSRTVRPRLPRRNPAVPAGGRLAEGYGGRALCPRGHAGGAHVQGRDAADPRLYFGRNQSGDQAA